MNCLGKQGGNPTLHRLHVLIILHSTQASSLAILQAPSINRESGPKCVNFYVFYSFRFFWGSYVASVFCLKMSSEYQEDFWSSPKNTFNQGDNEIIPGLVFVCESINSYLGLLINHFQTNGRINFVFLVRVILYLHGLLQDSNIRGTELWSIAEEFALTSYDYEWKRFYNCFAPDTLCPLKD